MAPTALELESDIPRPLESLLQNTRQISSSLITHPILVLSVKVTALTLNIAIGAMFEVLVHNLGWFCSRPSTTGSHNDQPTSAKHHLN